MTNPEARILGTLTGTCVVGIDVAKAWLDVAVRPAGPSETPWRVANSDAALPALAEQLRALTPQVIVLEATGGYEQLVVARLAEVELTQVSGHL